MSKIVSDRSLPKVFFVFLVIIFSLSAAAVFLTKVWAQKKTDLNFNFTATNYADFLTFAKKVGSVQAYTVLKNNFLNNDISGHNFAHLVGTAAYDQQGIAGMSVCDSAFNYGCYHGFVEEFLKVGGTSSMNSIESACIALGPVNANSCLHGIGHGVMAISYDLDKALKTCDLLDLSSSQWCWDGVFMERNTGSMLSSLDKFTLSSQTLMKPCEDLNVKYQDKCWRNQVFAWYSYFGADVQKVAGMCSRINSQFSETCFRNLGYQIVQASGTVDGSFSVCGQISLQKNIDWCLLGAMEELMFEGKNPDLVQDVCNLVSNASKQECRGEFADQRNQFRLRFGK